MCRTQLEEKGRNILLALNKMKIYSNIQITITVRTVQYKVYTEEIIIRAAHIFLY